MSKTLKGKEVWQALLSGEKLRLSTCDDFIFMNGNGDIEDGRGRISNDVHVNPGEGEWVIYEEPQEKPLIKQSEFITLQIVTEADGCYLGIENNEDWYKALVAFMSLRGHPLARKSEDKKMQYIISLFTNKIKDIFIEKCWGLYKKATNLSPCFNSEEDAQKAINDIGEENIISMFKVFAGIE